MTHCTHKSLEMSFFGHLRFPHRASSFFLNAEWQRGDGERGDGTENFSALSGPY